MEEGGRGKVVVGAAMEEGGRGKVISVFVGTTRGQGEEEDEVGVTRARRRMKWPGPGGE